MSSGGVVLLRVAVLVAVVGFAASSFISADVLSQAHGSTGRHLLQTKTNCPVNFEFLNYTIITSQCKGPQYPPTLCCNAFKQFACPYSTDLNDESNDCASMMFTYINLYGKYPPGLFSSECRDGKQGLDCSAVSSQKISNSGYRETKTALASLVLLVSGIVFSILFS